MLNAKGQTNCPNCGAPITSEKCPYCGTVFYDFSCIDFFEPTYIKIKHNGNIVMCKAIAKSAAINYKPQLCSYTKLGDTTPTYVKVGEQASISLEFDVLDDEGILFTAVKED